MPPLTPADASLILEHVVGDAAVPTAVARALLAGLPFPSSPSPRLQRSLLLRHIASDPLSPSSLHSLHLLSSFPPASSPLAAAFLAVAAYLAVAAPDFDAAAVPLFARPAGLMRRVLDGEAPLLASPEAAAAVDQFEAALGNPFAQAVLLRLWGDRATAEEKVRELVAAEWAAIGPSRLDVAAERIFGDGAVETWRAAGEATRAKYRALVGEERTREILSKLGEPTSPRGAISRLNPVPTPEVQKVMNALKSSCVDLHNAVVDPLPAALTTAAEVLATRMNKAQGDTSQTAACVAAGPSSPTDKGKGPMKSKPHSLMDRNSTAHTYQWDDSNESSSDGTQAQLPRPHLPSPRRTAVSPLQVAENKCKRRKARKWSLIEEVALRKGVEEYGSGRWKDILANNTDVFIGRTAGDLKDKWRNMTR